MKRRDAIESVKSRSGGVSFLNGISIRSVPFGSRIVDLTKCFSQASSSAQRFSFFLVLLPIAKICLRRNHQRQRECFEPDSNADSQRCSLILSNQNCLAKKNTDLLNFRLEYDVIVNVRALKQVNPTRKCNIWIT